MRYLLITIFLYCAIFFSCTQVKHNTTKSSIKDSVLKELLLGIDSLPYYDTTEINYKVLKAYQNNDTTFLKNLISQIKREKEYKRYWSSIETCIHQQKLQELGVDEAYRFIYLPAFCSTPINVTVTRKGDSVNLHFLLYQNKFDTVSCKIISEYDKKLTSKEWEEFNNKLSLADIWGLKRENGIHGVDGSNITFIGYQKGNSSFNRPDKISYVNRWQSSTVYDALIYILKLSGNNKGCFWIQQTGHAANNGIAASGA